MGRLVVGVALLLIVAAGCTRDARPDPRVDRSAKAAHSGGGAGPATDSSSPVPAWPQWRGPRGDGVSTETGWSAKWPSTGLKTLWQTNVGTGFSSISVAAGRAPVSKTLVATAVRAGERPAATGRG